jgi:hypothetical protein
MSRRTLMSKTARAGFAALLLLTLAAPLGAQADAADWLQKMQARTAEGHYKFRFKADMNVAEEGMQAKVLIDGSMNYATAVQFSTAFDVNMDMSGMAMTMKMKTIADGKNFWLEIDSPMMGGKQVMTGTTDQLKKLSQLGGADLRGLGGLGQDPIEQISGLADKFDLKVASREEGRVTLHAEISEEELAALGEFASLGVALDHITLVLDEKEGLPLQLELGAEQPFVTIDFVDYEFFKVEDVRQADYAYQPPEGVPVNDIGAMLGD